VESWHGNNLPKGMVLPKIISDVINKVNKKLTSFGCSDYSATFWFEDESWIRTQLVSDEWPIAQLEKILNAPSNPWPIPEGLFEGLSAIGPFSDDGFVYFDTGLLKTHAADGVGATYEIHGLTKSPPLSIKRLALLHKLADKIDFAAPGPHEGTVCLKFRGNNVRGGLMGKSE
jgi:hypothetical protein